MRLSTPPLAVAVRGAVALLVTLAAAPAASAGPPLHGTWTYTGGDAEDLARKAAIDKATEGMSRIARGSARSRLAERTVPAPSLTLAVDGQAFTLTQGGRTITLRFGAAPVEVERNGETKQMSVERAGDRVVLTGRGEDGQATTTYGLSEDGTRLTVTTRMTAPRIPEPLEYRSTYSRAR